jgi:predicted outer membrane repeat protein
MHTIFSRNTLNVLLVFSFLISLFGMTPAAPAHAAGLCYVNDDASGSNNGTSWADAYTSLQSAIAYSCTEIWVAAGTYKPDASDRTISFNLESGTAIYGGFAGTETLFSQRDYVSNVTTLSGDLNGDDIEFSNNGENSYHVVNGGVANNTAILNGFTIIGGNANGSSANSFGGGMYNNSSSPSLANITFVGNAGDTGGGMYNNSSSPSLTNVTFVGNTANYGGGMYNFSSNPSFTNVTFIGNTANEGGGMYNLSSSPSLTTITFSSNTGNISGGGLINDLSSPSLTNVTFSGNTAPEGGGMYNRNSSFSSLTNVTFSSNTAGYGGGMYTTNTSHPNLTNVTFSGNTASTSGGGIFVTGLGSSLNLKNVIIANSGNGDCVLANLATTTSVTNNLIESTGPNSCGLANGVDGNITGPDPNLGTLTGSPAYFPLNAGSLAINAGTNTGCPSTDQRGVARPEGTNCDIGAYEYQDLIDPTVSSIVRASTSPTTAASVNYTVTFSEDVQNVDVSDFTLTKSSGISGESVSAVSGSGSTYTVTVNTGSGSGTLRLDVPVSATIQDLFNNSLGGLPFTSGESYTKVVSATYKSAAANDGWILESSETSNSGGTMNSAATTLTLGDDATDKQYRAILHFDTSALPDTAVVTNMTLKIKQQGAVTGVSPFAFGSLYIDMRNPAFGGSPLELTDFNFAAKKVKSAIFNPNAVENWFSARFNTGGNLYVNRTGTTQLRLYFSVDDNNNNIADFIRFYSGNASAGDRPKLLITYYVP